MKRYTGSLINKIASLSILPLLFQGCKTEEPKPNFVFFLVDDMGYSDVGCFGSNYYETPNIDRLAQQGMRFTSAYAACTVSSPTRASILTGKYPGRLHITHAIPILGYERLGGGKATPLKDADYVMNLPLEEITIAEALKPAGYATISIGKWHVCKDPEYFPEYQGFDRNIGGNGHGNTEEYFYPYHNKWRMAEGYPWEEWNTLPDGVPGEYITDRLTDEAVKFIEENKDRSFFLYLPHYAVHTPIQAKDSLIKKYENKPVDNIKGHNKPDYAAMIESVDNSMGAIMKKLEELGLDKNTIIIFTSDNGGHGRWTSNYPFRGNKGNFYEGGIRVPLIIKWPGVTKPAKTCDVPVISTDYYPTMLQMANLPLMPEQHMDGLSLLPLLKNKGNLNRDALYWHFPNYTGTGHPNPSSPLSVIRFKNWKLIESLEDGHLELYDLNNDIHEDKNMADEKPDIAEKLQHMLAEWRKDVNVQMPEVNPDYIKE
ncbi:MAG: sulfatase [Bacteroidia bacterium]|nr:sulfatase [Bacteroidia bacterium]